MRELGVEIGHLRPGLHNAITDVAGIRVGHTTLIEGSGELKRGKGPVRCGVTAIIPRDDVYVNRLMGGAFILNGAGEVAGLTQVAEWGLIETPILLTNTMSVGKVSDATVKWMTHRYPGIGHDEDVVIPIVGECDDSFLNDSVGRHIRTAHVTRAIESASAGPVVEGSVGAGTGMICCDFKAGIGTSSRILPNVLEGFTVGVLVLSNFGTMDNLRIDGVPVGHRLAPRYEKVHKRTYNYGSIITVVATDAPLLPSQLNRLAKRAALGIGRCGSYAAHGSGEIILAFSTANLVPRTPSGRTIQLSAILDSQTRPLYEGVIEATEEAIINSMCAAEDMTGQGDHFVPALPLDAVARMFRERR